MREFAQRAHVVLRRAIFHLAHGDVQAAALELRHHFVHRHVVCAERVLIELNQDFLLRLAEDLDFRHPAHTKQLRLKQSPHPVGQFLAIAFPAQADQEDRQRLRTESKQIDVVDTGGQFEAQPFHTIAHL